MIVFLFITISTVLCLTVIWVLRLFQTRRWLSRSRQATLYTASPTSLFVVIPVLDEVGRIEDTVEYFCKHFFDSQTHIVLVTTEREREIWPTGSPQDTIAAVARLEQRWPQVKALQYPRRSGWMAHQLNFAYRWILTQTEDSRALVAVYNADSRPEPQTFSWIRGYLNKNPDAQAFQQFGLYKKNLSVLRHRPDAAILEAAAWWQIRWSLGFEIPNALRQQRFAGRETSLYPLTYAIGHGLFLTLGTLVRLGGFSEETRNEDAILGMQLSYERIPLVPVPYFDWSDAADSLSGWLTQQTNWFFGPAQAWKYIRLITKNIGAPVHRRIYVLALELFLHAVYWMAGPTLMVVSLLVGAMAGLSRFLLVWIVWSVYLLIPFAIPYIQPNIFPKQDAPGRPKFSALMLGSIPMYALHGLGAYRAVALMIGSRLKKTAIPKSKTPMVDRK